MSKRTETVAITTPHTEGDGHIGQLREIVGFHLRLAHGAVYRNFVVTFADLDLTQKQVSVLWLIDDHPSIPQAGLAERMRMDRATTMSIVKRLEARGFVKRGRSETDGRKVALNLTRSGRETLRTAKVAIQEHERWLKSRFSDREVKRLVDYLSRIHE